MDVPSFRWGYVAPMDVTLYEGRRRQEEGWARWAAGVRLGLFSFSPFFPECFFSSFCHRISGKRKDGDRERLRKISKQVQTYLQNNFKGLQLFYFMFTSI
jgi:hypothetical protein